MHGVHVRRGLVDDVVAQLAAALEDAVAEAGHDGVADERAIAAAVDRGQHEGAVAHARDAREEAAAVLEAHAREHHPPGHLPRYTRDTPEMQVRCRGDAGEMRGRATPESTIRPATCSMVPAGHGWGAG